MERKNDVSYLQRVQTPSQVSMREPDAKVSEGDDQTSGRLHAPWTGRVPAAPGDADDLGTARIQLWTLVVRHVKWGHAA